MKIAYLIDRLDASRGGAEAYSFDFTARLAVEGHEVHVFSRADSLVPPGVTLRAVKVRGLGRPWRTLSFAHEVGRMLSKEAFDVVHGTGWTYSQDVFQPHSGVHRHVGVVESLLGEEEGAGLFSGFLHRIAPKEIVYRRIERTQYVERPARVFVALSEMVRRTMQVFYRIPEERIEVVYNGVNAERFHPRLRETRRPAVRTKYGIGAEEIVFLIVAHNFRLKGVPDLVECVTGTDFPPCRLIVAGRGEPGGLRRHAERLAPGRVIFTGAVDDAAPLYAAADAYVHPTYYDPCSLVALEALASGLPVVTTVKNGVHELMTQGKEGRVIAPGDRAQLRGALLDLFDPEVRARMGRAARALAEQHTVRHNYLRMLEVYDKVLRLKGKT